MTEAGRLQNKALAVLGPLLERLSTRLLPRRTKKAWRKLSAGVALRPGGLARLRRWRDRMGAALGPLEAGRAT